MFNERTFRIALAEAGKTQRQVARECGINENSFSKIKRGSGPGVLLALKIAQAVNRKVEDLWSLGE
jgi:DNA-binding XRE family transcriptional regulator